MAQETDEYIVCNPPDEVLNRVVGHWLDSNKVGGIHVQYSTG
jgi:hypothetical protein